MNKIIYPIVNTVSLIITLIVNYLSNTGFFNDQSIADISAKYENLFTPAGYTFSIWGFIYLFLLGFVMYQWYSWSSGKGYDVSKPGFLLAFANILNSTWVILWVNDELGLSVLVMLLILTSLLAVAFKVSEREWDASKGFFFWVWLPIQWYFGWIILATVANISGFFVKMDIDMIFSDLIWGITMITISTGIYLFLLIQKNLREASLVGVWGLIGIAAKQYEPNPLVSYYALFATLILFLIIAVKTYRSWNRPLIG